MSETNSINTSYELRRIKVPRLDSDLLRTFLAVARGGTVSRGADRLFRTQSAVSLQLQKLEDTVGQQLFRRHGRGVTLTTAGEKLLPTARRVVSSLDQAVLDMRSGHLEGEIRIGIPDEYGESVLASILAGFAAAHPDAQITVRCGSSVHISRMVAAGEIDIALHSTETTSPEDVVVHRKSAVWAGSVFHEMGDRSPLPVALFDKACWWRSRCLELLDKSRRELSKSPAQAKAWPECVRRSYLAVRSECFWKFELQPAISRILSGNPAVPRLGDSVLVLTKWDGAPKALAEAMTGAIFAAFQETTLARTSMAVRAS